MLFQNKESPVLEQFSLNGKVSLITGGLRGIGLAAAKGLAEAGSQIAITYNTSGRDYIAEIEKQFFDLGVKFKAYQCNVSEKEQIIKCVNQVLADFKRLDVVVPNSGITSQAPAEDFSEEAYRNTMAVNLDGAFFTAQAAANSFKKQKKEGKLDQGRIIFTASVSSLVVNIPQNQAPYNASKAGLVRLAKCLSVEWVDFARVNCVSPGFITTDMLHSLPSEWRDSWLSMVPAQRFCLPYELKGVYVFLASDASSYITGDELVVGGGYTLT
ncbi:uncharacterized protein AC631_03574 [Debaryomyces fabryi]|uniref:L-xylulose reductase n=1 Tax=Debaryomyces fabryi TaxID=58627 RepID=A0A0V1PWQ6_9ASCO|nr:uncharacterized protein AC631_03574 [Debaryomyces fabryi]KSA00699.1 hypothetical protein AC631_03574 [Debaryomyces fabryi]CUM48164.1 unnamed protein product [Debaryomyces fabryi]